MRRWFLSYHLVDQALAERLKAALERKATEVFSTPSSLRAGGFWSKAVAEEIAQADAFILLGGEGGVDSWQMIEYYEALDKRVKFPNFPVILVLLEGQTAPGLPFLRQLHWIITPDPSSEKDLARLLDAASGGSTRPGELWRYTSPYRGLAAMEETDSDYFFGRERETFDVLSALAAAPDQLPVLLGNSSVGKSSLARAGVLGALKRQACPRGVVTAPEWPQAFQESRRWCFLTLKPGTEPLNALVESFVDTWQLGAANLERVEQRNGWIKLLRDGKAMLRDLLDATEQRYKELGQTKPPAFLLYVDQGEELYVLADKHQRHRFSGVIAQGVADPRMYMLMSMGAEFISELQKDEPLFKVLRQIDVPALDVAALREIVIQPPALLSVRYDDPDFADVITWRTAEHSGDIGMLSYILSDMWAEMVKRGDGLLRARARHFDPGGLLVYRAESFLADHPKMGDEVRRIFIVKLVALRGEEEPASRRRALRSEFTYDEWQLVSQLSSHPARLLVTATSEHGETYAEVVHEEIFRRWEKLRQWIASDRQFIVWKTGLEAARRAWQVTPDDSLKDYALLMGFALLQAQEWLAKRAKDIAPPEQVFITESIKHWEASTRIGRPVKVFISYRREDSKWPARQMYEAFLRHVPHGQVFIDIDSIPPGADFVKILEHQVEACEMVLALIGRDWNTDPRTGRRRLDDPKDFVCIEICAALSRDIPVVPVLLDGEPMPEANQLPEDMRMLARRQAESVGYRTFGTDVDRLIKRLGFGNAKM